MWKNTKVNLNVKMITKTYMVFLIIIVEVEKPDDEEEIESKEEMKIDNKEENKEGLAYDNSAYEMFHRASLDWPCLSIDFVLPNRLDTNFDMFNPHMKLPESLLVDYVNPMTSEKSKRHKEGTRWSTGSSRSSVSARWSSRSSGSSRSSMSARWSTWSSMSSSVWHFFISNRGLAYLYFVQIVFR